MHKKYLDKNVYEKALERLDFIFKEFDNIVVSFSGGKDSGLLLDLVVDFKRKHYPDRRIALFHQDFEAQYSATTEYVERTFERLSGELEPYWVCLPMATRTAVSNYEMYWYPWNDTEKEKWVRKMPEYPYVYNLDNNPISTYSYRMRQEDLAKQFCRWYKMKNGNKRTVCLLGIRADESLNRYSGFLNKKYGYKGECWITRQFKDTYTAAPLYDFALSDVWHAIYKFDYDHNGLYDLFYMAGMAPDNMRVASPFNDYAKESLNYYRVIDPDVWTRLVGRVCGANFGAICGRPKSNAYRDLTLPQGYTWKSYTRFLLSTLPKKVRQNYIKKFKTSIEFWHNTGGGLPEETIRELIENGYNIRQNGISNYTLLKNRRIVFIGEIPDHTDDIRSSRDVPSWKRMCYCILRNDHTCRFMGFGPTRIQQKSIDLLRKKYREIGADEN